MEQHYAVNCNFTENSALNGSAIYYGNATACNFIGNNAGNDGGAIYYGNATACNFIDNKAVFRGGAIFNGTATNCNFTNNTADFGGAIYENDATGCNFIGNNATYAGAIYRGNATDCNFKQNSASEGGAMNFGTATNCNFTGNQANKGGATYYTIATDCIFTENSASEGGAMYEGSAKNCTFQFNIAKNGTDFYPDDVADEDCTFNNPIFNASDLNATYNNKDKFNFTLTLDDQVFNDVNVTISIYKNGVFVANYTALSGQGWTIDLPVGTYTAELSIPGSNVVPVNKTITVDKDSSKITASPVTAVYNKKKYFVIKLADGKGNALSGVKLKVTLGATTKTYTTDKNGQIKINLAKWVPKKYTAKISFAGNENYTASSKTVKVTVKKAAAKITAKKKTFKVKVKTKKYTITLKNNIKKAIKGAKVTLKVNKRTFKAKTNKKGKAVFKIKNLKKKGTYKAVIKFAGNKYYNKVTKKVKIRVKK